MAETTDYPVCRHCGARIQRINFALGPEWMHWPTPDGNYHTSELYRSCKASTIAEPMPGVEAVWVHCSPELLEKGLNCARAPRRACQCEPWGAGHDHAVVTP